ncbi:MAG: glycosyl hydrolase 2 galactose-binding domain-containing protein, partial [Flavobacteriales bacterium]
MKPVWTLGAGLVLAFLASCAPETSDRISLADLGASWQVGIEGRAPVDAHVPGFVLQDLVRAGLAPAPYTGTHERDVQWVEDSTWTYTASFVLPRGWSAFDSATLEFQGLNVFAAVEVNDLPVLNADNAHRTWTTTPFQLLDSNRLRVTFIPAPEEGQRRLDAFGMALPASNEAKPIGRQVSPFVRKPGYQFGWDWGPRLAGPGIHGDVVLQRHVQAVRPVQFPWMEVVHADSTEAWLLCHGWDSDFSLELTLNGQVQDWQRRGDTVVVPHPELWWPIHMGGQPLYEARWAHRSSGEVHHERWGIRDLEWVQTPDDHGTSFQLTVQGVPVFARGANVVPPDFHDFTDAASWLGVVQNAVDAHMNMLRVWGGGVYPPKAFFDACDAQGILVWQDFMFACAMVPDNPAFQDNVKAEATAQVKRLRHHPSLALWCGNNEVAKAWESWGWQEMYNLHGQDSARVAQAAT